MGRVGSGPRHNLPHPPLPSVEPMPGLQKEAGLAASGGTPMSLRTRFSHRKTAEAATSDLVAINAAMYRAAGVSPGADAELDLEDCGFPPEMLDLKLGALLRLILFVGSIREETGCAGNNGRFQRLTSLPQQRSTARRSQC